MTTPSRTVGDLVREVSDAIATRRRLIRFLESPTFTLAYARADDAGRGEAVALVAGGEPAPVEAWASRQFENRFALLSMRQLRIAGRQLGVRGYNNMPKSTLLEEVVSHAKAAGRLGARPTECLACPNA